MFHCGEKKMISMKKTMWFNRASPWPRFPNIKSVPNIDDVIYFIYSYGSCYDSFSTFG